jgi:antitoxin (DNA-binding transcriptional repressor) of toxin-antitoxin stability system
MREVSIWELRNHGGEVIERVRTGERVVITRDGEPVAELRALSRPRLGAEALVEHFRRLPPVDPVRFRADIDDVLDSL